MSAFLESVPQFTYPSNPTCYTTSALRVVFARYKQIDKIEFIEIYSKGDKDREDKKRIDDFLKHLPIDSS